MDLALQNRDDLLALLKSHMAVAQNRMKQHTDQKRTEREFQIGDWVYLKLHPYRRKSLIQRPYHKLAPRFYGPFQISAKVGHVAYRLQLPANSKLHPVFHVSLLKPKVDDHTPVSVTLPPFDSSGSVNLVPQRVLDMAVHRKRNRSITKWLIQWAGLPESDSTWEEAHSIMNRFPTFQA